MKLALHAGYWGLGISGEDQLRLAQEADNLGYAAIGPKNTALAAEIADGWLPTLYAPDHADVFEDSLKEGAARANRSADEIDVAPMTSVAIDEDADRARDLMRPF